MYGYAIQARSVAICESDIKRHVERQGLPMRSLFPDWSWTDLHNHQVRRILHKDPCRSVQSTDRLLGDAMIMIRSMMTSSNGNIFRVTGQLCGEFTGPRWIPRTKASDAELWWFICVWTNDSVKTREAGDLRRFRAYYGVIVLSSSDLLYCQRNVARSRRSHSQSYLISSQWNRQRNCYFP